MTVWQWQYTLHCTTLLYILQKLHTVAYRCWHTNADWANCLLIVKSQCLVFIIIIFFSKNSVFFYTRWLKAILSIQRIVIFNKSTTKFSMVHTLIDHRNEFIKCWKLKWKPQPSGFTAKFWTFYDVISMVYKSVDHGKVGSICFLQ